MDKAKRPKMWLPAGVSEEAAFACLQCDATFTTSQQQRYERHVVNCEAAQTDYDLSKTRQLMVSPLWRSATREELEGKVDLELEDWARDHKAELDEGRKRL